MEWDGKFYRKDNCRGVLWNGMGSFTEKITLGVFYEWDGKFYKKDNSRGVSWNGMGSFTEKITLGVFYGMGWEVLQKR